MEERHRRDTQNVLVQPRGTNDLRSIQCGSFHLTFVLVKKNAKAMALYFDQHDVQGALKALPGKGLSIERRILMVRKRPDFLLKSSSS